MGNSGKFDSEGYSQIIVRMWVYFCFVLLALNIFINRRNEPVELEKLKIQETYIEKITD